MKLMTAVILFFFCSRLNAMENNSSQEIYTYKWSPSQECAHAMPFHNLDLYTPEYKVLSTRKIKGSENIQNYISSMISSIQLVEESEGSPSTPATSLPVPTISLLPLETILKSYCDEKEKGKPVPWNITKKESIKKVTWNLDQQTQTESCKIMIEAATQTDQKESLKESVSPKIVSSWPQRHTKLFGFFMASIGALAMWSTQKAVPFLANSYFYDILKKKFQM